MAYYKPCKNCAVTKSECPVRASVASAIAGLHVTAINFVCKARQPMFRLGQRVSFKWRVFENTEYGDVNEYTLIFAGTVLHEKGLKFIVRVDDAPALSGDDILDASDVFKSDRLIIKVMPADMTPLDEPDRIMCGACCAYADEPKKCQGWGSPDSWDSYWPPECINRHGKLSAEKLAEAI